MFIILNATRSTKKIHWTRGEKDAAIITLLYVVSFGISYLLYRLTRREPTLAEKVESTIFDQDLDALAALEKQVGKPIEVLEHSWAGSRWIPARQRIEESIGVRVVAEAA